VDNKFNGIFANDSSSATLVLDRVRLENNGEAGIHLRINTGGTINATVRDSVSARNGGTGVFAAGGGGGAIHGLIVRSAIVNNFAGISSQGSGATVRLGNSTVTGNGTGLHAADSGVLESYGTNKVDGNGTDGAPTSTIAMK